MRSGAGIVSRVAADIAISLSNATTVGVIEENTCGG